MLGSNPLDALSRPNPRPAGDSDGDSLPDSVENIIGSDPLLRDTDGDDIHDGIEFIGYGSSPAAADSDADGCPDVTEVTSINQDYVVSSLDLLAVAQRFGTPGTFVHDVNRNGAVNALDLSLVAQHFVPNPCGP